MHGHKADSAPDPTKTVDNVFRLQLWLVSTEDVHESDGIYTIWTTG